MNAGYLGAAMLSDITRLINAAEAGDKQASRELFDLVYADLKRMASIRLANENSGQTLQPTALVHEVYLRMFGIQQETVEPRESVWRSRGHFFGAAAEAMRRILVEAARRKGRLKHGGGRTRELLDPDAIAEPDLAEELLVLNEALDALAATDEKSAKLVMLRYFGGLTLKEAAASMGISPRTADSYWAYARVWLLSEMQRLQAGDPKSSES
ncbi:MAG: polymerase subunit sigma [Planctomycetaceae bacterium]|nr:polymerase subunit sigma [Planctomycetaceae bacterium]